jgi:hippurate hydrolase
MSRVPHVLATLAQTALWQEELYRLLHAHPELSMQEHATAALAAERLRGWGYKVLEHVGGTGVVGVLCNGEGQVALMRADMDALPVKEDTGLPYASQATGVDENGDVVPVMHACGHDVHVTCLLGAAELLAAHRDAWRGTFIALFQPAEEYISGAGAMLADGLAQRIPRPDVALAQHVLTLPAGSIGLRAGPILAGGDSLRVTVFGRSAHASTPHLSVDPVVLAAHIVIRLQTVVARETRPGEFAVLTIGSLVAGSAGNIIPDSATLLVDVRAYDADVRARLLAAITRIVRAECAASGAPREPLIESYGYCGPVVNDEQTAATVTAAFADHFGHRLVEIGPQTAGEDFGVLADGLGARCLYWIVGGTDPQLCARAAASGRHEDIPSLHSPHFAPLIQPTLTAGTEAIVVATLAFLSAD